MTDTSDTKSQGDSEAELSQDEFVHKTKVGETSHNEFSAFIWRLQIDCKKLERNFTPHLQ